LKDLRTEIIRNIATGAHSGSGKTSLVEAMLYSMGIINRMGTVEQGNTVSDYNEDEIERQISINSSILHGAWNKHKINIIDTPGFMDFFGDVVASFYVADLILVMVSAASGVEVGTEMVWQEANKREKPRFLIVNKLDRENIDFNKIVSELKDAFGNSVTLCQFPVETGPNFFKIIDIVRNKMLTFPNDKSGKYTEEDIPADLKDKAEELRNELIESVAENDEALMEKYFEAGELTEEELKTGLRNAIKNQLIYPVFCTSASNNVGVTSLMDAIVEFGPSPLDLSPVKGEDGSELAVDSSGPLAALVFKTISEAHVGELSFVKVFSGTLKQGMDVLNSSQDVSERIGQMFFLNGKNKDSANEIIAGDIGALVKLKNTHTGDTLCDKSHKFKFPKIEFPEPIIRIAIKAKAKGEEDKIANGLHSLHEEDPTFVVKYDPELKQTIVSGQGEMHLDIILKRLKQRFGVEVETEKPKIPYRETIRSKAEAQGKYKKQSGGRGQYGDCWLRLEPLPRGTEFEFVDAIVGGVIPGKFIPAVEKGVRETMEEGVLAGYPVVDVKVTVYDGSYHSVDSSEMAFKIAASMAFKKAFIDAKPVMLEPIYDVEVRVPEEFMGDVMGDISSRRGKIQGMESDGRFQIIKAKVPEAELYKYSTALRSMTQGRGIHKRSFSHYEEVPPDIQQKIIEEAQKEKEQEG
jgi:elongation factor G